MRPELRELVRAAPDLSVAGDEVTVKFAEGRRHVVTVSENEDAIGLCGIVTRSRDAAAVAVDGVNVWRRHRSLSFVSFRIDRHGRLVGESWVPKAGMSGEELRMHVRLLAAECDRFEHALTGRDVE